MRETTGIDSSWRYVPDFREDYLEIAFPLDDWEEIELPHANIELPYNGFDEKSCQFVSSYARELGLQGTAGGKRVFLDFGGVMTACDLWVNGRRAGGHEGGYTPFSVEITDFLLPGGANRLLLRVDSTERSDIPPFGHVIDYLGYGGVYREVSLRVQDQFFIADVFARPGRVLEEEKSLEVELALDLGRAAGPDAAGAAARAAGLSIVCALREITVAGTGGRLVGEARAALAPGSASARVSMSGLRGLRNWDLADPALYRLDVSLLRDGEELDRTGTRVGFRSAEWRPEGFFLNGRRVPIIGLNRHQAWPYSGYAMPARAQRRDAQILKRELGLNLVRTSHYPQSVHFLDACDELGLLVFEELPGWQHVGDKAWQDKAARALEEMIRRDRNRPCVVLWGARINESMDSHDFYARANTLARELDPTRQTGGARHFTKSELLEDVYTFNDFVHSGAAERTRRPRSVTGLGRGVPYLVSEHNGHMFPTKRFDNEERLAEQALRHARVLDSALSRKDCAGAVGWCAFDYNTHKDFGSGDRICYHGVSDMFRIPKYAAALYASQAEQGGRPVLEAASLFAKGERNAARLLPIEVYTNCDEVVLYRGGSRVGSYFPERRLFPGLPHPPVVIRDLVGDLLEGSAFSPGERRLLRRIARIFNEGLYTLGLLDRARVGLVLLRHRKTKADAEAFLSTYVLGWGREDGSFELAGLVGGKEVVRRRYGGDARAERLAIAADDAALQARPASGGWDCTRVVLRLEDQYGNIHPFAPEAVDIELSGPGRVIGPSRLALIGGCIAFWLRTTGEAGELRVRARGVRFCSEEIAVAVR